MEMEKRIYKKGEEIVANVLYTSKINLNYENMHENYLHSMNKNIHKTLAKYSYKTFKSVTISIKMYTTELMELEHFEGSGKCRKGYYKSISWKCELNCRDEKNNVVSAYSVNIKTESTEIEPALEDIIHEIKKGYDIKKSEAKFAKKKKERDLKIKKYQQELKLKEEKKKLEKEIKKDIIRNLNFFDKENYYCY